MRKNGKNMENKVWKKRIWKKNMEKRLKGFQNIVIISKINTIEFSLFCFFKSLYVGLLEFVDVTLN